MKIRQKIAWLILSTTVFAGANSLLSPIKANAENVGTINVSYVKASETSAVISVQTSSVVRTRLPNGNYSTQNNFTYTVSKNGTFDFEGEVTGGDRVQKSIVINDLRQNILITNNKNVALKLQADDTLSGVTHVRFKNESGGAWTSYESLTPTKNWVVNDGEGLKTVFVQYKDLAGNESNPNTDKIYLDINGPTVDFSINNNKPYTNNPIVNLAFNISDTISSVDKILLSNDNSNWTEIPFTSSTTWTIPNTVGNRTIYVKAKDSVGNMSNTISKSIYYDNVVPTGNILINNGDTATNSRDVSLKLNFADIHSGVDKVRIYEGSKMYEFPSVPSNPTTLPWTLNLGTTGQVTLEVVDKAGNVFRTNSNVINIITLKITEFKLTGIVNPLTFNNRNPFVEKTWDFPPQPMMSGGEIKFEVYYDLYDKGAVSSTSSGAYSLEIVGDNGYHKTLNANFEDRINVPGRGFKASFILPSDAPKNSKVYLNSNVKASIKTAYSSVEQTAYFPGPNSTTKAQIGYIQGNIKESLKFNEVQ